MSLPLPQRRIRAQPHPSTLTTWHLSPTASTRRVQPSRIRAWNSPPASHTVDLLSVSGVLPVGSALHAALSKFHVSPPAAWRATPLTSVSKPSVQPLTCAFTHVRSSMRHTRRKQHLGAALSSGVPARHFTPFPIPRLHSATDSHLCGKNGLITLFSMSFLPTPSAQ